MNNLSKKRFVIFVCCVSIIIFFLIIVSHYLNSKYENLLRIEKFVSEDNIKPDTDNIKSIPTNLPGW